MPAEDAKDLDKLGAVPAPSKRAPKHPTLGRTAQQVIDQAIADNKPSEYLLYVFATVFVLCGMITLIAGLIQKEGLLALAGGVASTLFLPAMSQARQIRRENIAIRLLESPLSMAETTHDAAEALKDFFVDTFKPRRANP